MSAHKHFKTTIPKPQIHFPAPLPSPHPHLFPKYWKYIDNIDFGYVFGGNKFGRMWSESIRIQEHMHRKSQGRFGSTYLLSDQDIP